MVGGRWFEEVEGTSRVEAGFVTGGRWFEEVEGTSRVEAGFVTGGRWSEEVEGTSRAEAGFVTGGRWFEAGEGMCYVATECVVWCGGMWRLDEGERKVGGVTTHQFLQVSSEWAERGRKGCPLMVSCSLVGGLREVWQMLVHLVGVRGRWSGDTAAGRTVAAEGVSAD